MFRVQCRILRSFRPYSVSRRLLTGSTSSGAAPKQPPVGAQGPVTWKGLAVVTALGTLGLAYYSKERERRITGRFFIAC